MSETDWAHERGLEWRLNSVRPPPGAGIKSAPSKRDGACEIERLKECCPNDAQKRIFRLAGEGPAQVPERYPAGIGPRVALFLRETYAQDRAKAVARQFRVSVSTAQRWLDGHAPTTAHLEAMCALWGAPFVTAIFAEAATARDQHVTALLEARAKLLAELQHPSDPLKTARKLKQADFRWGWIWAPPDEEYSARRVPGIYHPPVEVRPSAPSQMRVDELLAILEGTVPQPGFWERARNRLLQR